MTREALLLEKARAVTQLMIATLPAAINSIEQPIAGGEERPVENLENELLAANERLVDRIFRHVEAGEWTPEPQPQPILRVGTMADVMAGRAELPCISLLDAHLIPWRPWQKYWAVDADGSYWRYVSHPKRIGTASSWACFPTKEEVSTTPISERLAVIKTGSMEVWTSMYGPRPEGAPEASP